MTIPESKRRRWWLQFRLRTLLVLMTILCIGLGWLGKILIRVRTEREIVAQILAAGGHVRYDVDPDTPPGPWVIRRVVGNDAFIFVEWVGQRDVPEIATVVTRLPELAGLKRVGLEGPRIREAEMEILARIPNLDSLILINTPVTPTGIERLAGAPRLKSLTISDTNISAVTMKRIARLPHLQSLHLKNTLMTSDVLAELQAASQLEVLELRGSCVDDEVFRSIPSPIGLNELILFDTRLTSKGLSALAEIKSLRKVSLFGNQTTAPEVIKSLQALPHLESLYLDCSNVTVVGGRELDEISSLTRVKVLGIDGASVSQSTMRSLESMTNLDELSITGVAPQAAIDHLRKSRPDLKINWYR